MNACWSRRLTKKTAEDLTEYLKGVGLKVSYIHADVDAIERVEILRALRARNDRRSGSINMA